MQPHEVDLETLREFYDSPDTQAAAVHFIGHIRNYDKTGDDEFLYKAHDTSMSIYEKCPFNEVLLDGNITDSPNEIMMLICAHLSELGVMPNYE